MRFINLRELCRSLSKFVKKANEDDDIVITKNGHSYALLSKINDADLEEYNLAKYLNLEKEFKIAKNEYVSGDTTTIHNLLKSIKKQIFHQISNFNYSLKSAMCLIYHALNTHIF